MYPGRIRRAVASRQKHQPSELVEVVGVLYTHYQKGTPIRSTVSNSSGPPCSLNPMGPLVCSYSYLKRRGDVLFQVVESRVSRRRGANRACRCALRQGYGQFSKLGSRCRSPNIVRHPSKNDPQRDPNLDNYPSSGRVSL